MQLKRNTFSAFGQLLVQRLPGIAIFLLLTHTQGVAAAGLFALALTYTIIATSWWAGLDELVIREVAQIEASGVPDKVQQRLRLIVRYGVLRLLAATLLYLLIVGGLWGGGWYTPEARHFITIFLSSTIGEGLIGAVQAGLMGVERFQTALWIAALQMGLRLGLIVAALGLGLTMPLVAWGWVMSALVAAIFALAILWQLKAEHSITLFSLLPMPGQHGSLWLPASCSFLLIGIVATLEYQMDVLILAAYHSTTEVGYYSTATTFFSLGSLPIQAFRVAVFPMMTRVAAGQEKTSNDGAALVKKITEKNQLKTVYWRALRSVVQLALLCGLPGFFLAQPVIRLIFGTAMLPAVTPTQVMMVALFFAALNVPQTRLLFVTGQQQRTVYLVIISATVNAITNLFLAPTYGAMGSAVARCISAATFLGMASFWARRSLETDD